MPERLYTTYQVADLLGATAATVAEWMGKGWLSFTRSADGLVRVGEADLLRFLKLRGIDVAEVMGGGNGGASEWPGDGGAGVSAMHDDASASGEVTIQPPLDKPPAAVPTPTLRDAGLYVGDPPVESPKPAEAPPAAPQPARPVSQPQPGAAAKAAPAATKPIEPAPAPAAPRKPAEAPPPPEVAIESQVAQAILRDAAERRATDIHLEPTVEGMSLRFRIDGLLHDRVNFRQRLPKALGPKLTACLKALAGLEADDRRPASRPFKATVDGRQLQMEMNTLPTTLGQKLVIRLLDAQAALDLGELGLTGPNLRTLRHLLTARSGLVLVIGPGRCGKGTTLAAMTHAAGQAGRAVVTIGTNEMRIEGAAHCLLGEALGDRAAAIQAAARSDSDVIVVDRLTESAAMLAAHLAAQDGVLVVGAMPAGNLAEAVDALVAAGMPADDLRWTMPALVNQRLARRLCTHCRIVRQPAPELLEAMGLDRAAKVSAYAPKGCPRCSATGYAGRVGVFHLAATEEIRHALRASDDARPDALRHAGLLACAAGATSLEELARILPAAAR